MGEPGLVVGYFRSSSFGKLANHIVIDHNLLTKNFGSLLFREVFLFQLEEVVHDELGPIPNLLMAVQVWLFTHVFIDFFGLFQGHHQIVLELLRFLFVSFADGVLGDVEALVLWFAVLQHKCHSLLATLLLFDLEFLHELLRTEQLLGILKGHHRKQFFILSNVSCLVDAVFTIQVDLSPSLLAVYSRQLIIVLREHASWVEQVLLKRSEMASKSKFSSMTKCLS